MLVTMQAGASQGDVDAVAERSRAAGLRVTRFSGLAPEMLHLDGANVDDARDWLVAMPGVAGVAAAAEPPVPVTNNVRISGIRPLVPPAILQEQLSLPADGARTVHRVRRSIASLLDGRDDRLLVVVGPCSIHDADAALEYARCLAPVARRLADDLVVVMRVYFEKPRTTVGWKGLINDPHLDGSFAVNEGLRIARQLLLDVVALGLPAGCEFLDPITPQFIADTVSWGAIGARTTESQVHRNLTSGLSMPVGFKNGTGGDIQIAIDAMKAAAHEHQFMSVTEQGVAAIVVTRGNRETHLILRGGQTGPNYDAASVEQAIGGLRAAGVVPRLMVDASHGNSGKDYRRQPAVVECVAEQLRAGQGGIFGVMLESFLVDGRQELSDPAKLVHGQSITDSCMGWAMTEPVLEQLAAAVRDRRAERQAVH